MDLDHTLGLVLAGGLSRRMGGGDKALLPLAGRPMLAHAIERLRPQCATILLSANGDPARFAAFTLDVVADDPPDLAGPLAGVLAGLEICARRNPGLTHVVSLPADTPFAPRDLVARLGAALGSGAEIAVAASGGRTHHAAALWPVRLAADLRQALVGERVRKVDAFLRRHRTAVVEWPVWPMDPFFNVNIEEDLRHAETMLAGGLGSRPSCGPPLRLEA